ncbi:tetratricopeptide repeat protein [Brumimicrobium oceani]|uniref:Uncharacterized protein n=1 Tax=Brumimicrobium oceani TaxID=2100725 RepID=A0A2U2XC19_9FLAO|nr:tetratricopeptide repeat protein [Brumimicrobium oceani]PWH85332.1 hypothetical protein DIT68_10370 [Brumimicrobium oceani]
MKKFFFISSLILFPLTPILGQKGKENSMQEQVLDDVEALSSKNYPYIEQFHEAVREKMSGNYSEAKKLFNKCLEIKQDDDAVYFGLAEIAKAENKVIGALENFQKAYEIDKTNISYLQELAYIHFERANFEQAEHLFKEMVEREPRNLDFRYGYSKVLIYNKAYQLAIDELNSLQNQAGIVPELMMMKADLYSEIKEFEKAEETLLLLKKEYPADKEVLNHIIAFYEQRGKKEKAVALVNELAKDNPENGNAQFILASNLIDQGKFEEFFKIAPGILENSQVDVEQKLFVFDHLIKQKGTEDPLVLAMAEKFYQGHSEDLEVASKYVNILMYEGRSKEALRVARKATQDNSNNFESWRMALSVASTFLDYQALYEDGKSALELFPNIPFVYFAAAEGALYTNHPDEAMQYLAGGEIYLLDDKKKASLFSMRKGEVYFYTKEYKKGIVAFEKALNLNPEDQNTQVTYALALSKANIATDIAAEMLGKIAEKNRGRDFYLAKAMLAANENNLREAIDLLEKGISKKHNIAELLDYLGDLHFKNQSLSKAKEAWNQALTAESRNKNLPKKINEEKLYAPKYY